MKVIAEFKCEECGEIWDISKNLRDVEKEDLRCCSQYATINRYFRGVSDDKRRRLEELMED